MFLLAKEASRREKEIIGIYQNFKEFEYLKTCLVFLTLYYSKIPSAKLINLLTELFIKRENLYQGWIIEIAHPQFF